MSEHSHIINDQRQVDLEDYIAGMMQAAEIAEQYLYGQAAALIRGSAAVMQHSRQAHKANSENSQEPASYKHEALAYSFSITEGLSAKPSLEGLVESYQKAAEGSLWYKPYKDVIYDMMDGRLAHRVYGALTNFNSEAEFLRANVDDFAAIPLLGQKTIETLLKLQENWR
jgi:hypothetical protein